MLADLCCKLGYKFPSPSHLNTWIEMILKGEVILSMFVYTSVVCKLYLIAMWIKFPWIYVIALVMFNSLEIAFFCQNKTNTYP